MNCSKIRVKYISFTLFVFVLVLFFPVLIFGQSVSPVVKPPSIPIPKGPTVPNSGHNSPFLNQYQAPRHANPHVPDNTQQRNAALIREIEEYQALINSQKTQNEPLVIFAITYLFLYLNFSLELNNFIKLHNRLRN